MNRSRILRGLAWPRFRLSSLLIVVTIVCVCLAWWGRPKPIVIEAHFDVGTKPQHVIGAQPPFHPQEYDAYRESRAELVRREHVLMAALRPPKIASMSIVRKQSDPIEWLQEVLEVEFSGGPQNLVVRLRGLEKNREELVQLLDALAQALCRTVAAADRQEQLELRDEKLRAANRLRQRIEARLSRLQNQSVRSGKEDSAIDLAIEEMEIEVLRQTWQGLLRDIEIHEANATTNNRFRLMLPAMAYPE